MKKNLFKKKDNHFISNNCKTIFFINSKNLIIGMNNSVYDLCFYNNFLLILDYKNNKLLFYDLKKKIIKKDLYVQSPHGISNKKNLLYLSNYKKREILIIKNFKIIKKYKFKKYFPLNIIHNQGKILLINWNNNENKNLILLNEKFQYLKKFENHNNHDKPHSGVYFKKKIYITSHCNIDPKIIIYNPNGNIIKIIKNKYIKDPLSIKIFKNHFFIADYIKNCILVFDLKFNFKYFIKNKFYYPMNVTFDKNNLYICEENSNRILTYKINNE